MAVFYKPSCSNMNLIRIQKEKLLTKDTNRCVTSTNTNYQD